MIRRPTCRNPYEPIARQAGGGRGVGYRLCPITMTTLAAIGTLLPLALAFGAGSGVQQPLAIAIIAGLLLQYPLVLFVMPVLVRWSDRARAQPSELCV